MSDANWDWSTWRPAPVLPRNAGPDGGLGFTIAVLCFLACSTVLAALAADRAVSGWGRDLRAGVTIQVRPKGEESGGEAAARAAEALAGVKGVTEARSLDRAEAERLLRALARQGRPARGPAAAAAGDRRPRRQQRCATPAALNAALAQAGSTPASTTMANGSRTCSAPGWLRGRRRWPPACSPPPPPAR